ncbi:MAG: tRNA lysidine(34) synthetase TilS [Gammaproteobacteria bacterium]|nr:tRNA lysidine(34) synthetase TilS [Gammaproteobacteria bacterium]MBQ0840811.1 tRNA lysidine(34) synthetase TilS [Gammaproteobacteria bacterium]
MPPVLQQLQGHFATLDRAGQVYLGYSGGLDSHVLLHSAVATLGAERIVALHINHQLSEQAGAWAEHCAAMCRGLGVALQVHTVDVCRQASSTENTAREARYQVFEQVLEAGDILLLAHHQDDQAETVLYRLLRNSGPRGLSGIPLARAVGRGHLLRPLLPLPRSELEAYARQHTLNWIEDPSNADVIHDRNYLRHQITPALSQRWPDFAARIAASASLCQQANELNQDLAAIDFNTLAQRRERLGWSIELSGLDALSALRQANVLRYWVGLRGQLPPGYHSVMAVLDTLLPAGRDRAPLVAWPGGEWRRFNDRLFLLPAGWSEQFPQGCEWNPQAPLTLADAGTLSAEPTQGLGLKLLPGELLRIAFRSGGERCRPLGRAGSSSLKKLFQEYQLEPWLRDRIPLLYKHSAAAEKDAELIAVGDLWVCEGFAGDGRDAYRLRWDINVL